MRELEQEFVEGLADVRSALQEYDPGDENIQKISETVRYLDRISASGDLPDNDIELLETWLNQCIHVLDRWFGIDEAIGFRYYHSNLRENEYRARTHIMALVTALDAINSGEDSMDEGSSVWRETIHSLGEMRDDIEIILKSPNSDHQMFSWFVIFNTLEALRSMDESPDVRNLVAKYSQTAKTHEDSFKECKDESIGLEIYAYDLSEQGVIPIDVEHPNRRPSYARAKIFNCLGKLRRKEAVSVSNLPDKIPGKKPHLWAIARAWIKAKEDSPTGIVPFSSQVNIGQIFREIWGEKFDKINSVQFDESELRTVREMDDADIRNHLSNIFSNNRNVSTSSKALLNQEKEKSHTGAEISDFDVELHIEDKRTINVSSPIKSGREAGNQTAEKLAEQNLHQILRPFLRFSTAVVFPILIAGSSLNTYEDHKLLRDRLDMPILIIDDILFCKILKQSGEI